MTVHKNKQIIIIIFFVTKEIQFFTKECVTKELLFDASSFAGVYELTANCAIVVILLLK